MRNDIATVHDNVVKMADVIAKLLNSNQNDTKKIQELLHDYLEKSDDEVSNINSDESSDENEEEVNNEPEFDMRATDFDAVMQRVAVSNNILSGDSDLELDKASKFR